MTSLEIMQAVARWHGVPWSVFVSPIMVREVSICRWEAWYLVRKINCQSYPLIGRTCRFDHSSIIYGIKRFSRMIEEGIAIDHTDDMIEGRTPENVIVWNPTPNTIDKRVKLKQFIGGRVYV
jgi:chromosomal replication initiation ATPase DnaA